MVIRALIICNINDSASSKPDIELISGLHNQGIEVDVMIPEHSFYIEVFRGMGIRVIPAHPRKKFSIKTIMLIRKEYWQRRYHIIHLFNTRAIVNGSLAAIGLPIKVIAYRGAAGIYWYDPTAWWSHLNPRIDVLICNSYYVQQHMKHQLFCRPQKAVMIHKGMDIDWFSHIRPIQRMALGIPEQAIIVGCVANVRRIKGVPYLIKATYHLNPELPVHILLVGEGMDSRGNLRLIESSPFKDRIHIAGFRKDVYEVIAACDIYIQPSLSESLSRSVMEAMCLGLPCIVSDIGGLVELVEHEKSGLIVERGNPGAIADAIEQLANDPDKRKTFASEAMLRMKSAFSVENMVLNTRKLYEKILS
jgi:glycosyltransferase involved in cell wall biosynthesis